jgi:hypothetical protein
MRSLAVNRKPDLSCIFSTYILFGIRSLFVISLAVT